MIAVTEEAEKRGPERALRRAMGVLEGLWKALEILEPPPLEVAEFLIRRGKSGVEVRPYYGKEAEVSTFFPVKSLRFLTRFSTFPWVRLTGDTNGDVEAEVKGIFARKGKAFLREEHPLDVMKKAEAVRTLRPLFAALDLGDLGDALETLAKLDDGEARMEGEYLLIREGGTFGHFILKRGSLLGDFGLDKAFLLGEEVVLSYPGDVELTLRGGGFEDGLVRLAGLEIRWGEEKVRFGVGLKRVEARVNGNDPVGELVRKRVARELRKPDFRPSPRMQALLEALTRQKKPLRALKKEDFSRKVLLSTLSLV